MPLAYSPGSPELYPDTPRRVPSIGERSIKGTRSRACVAQLELKKVNGESR